MDIEAKKGEVAVYDNKTDKFQRLDERKSELVMLLSAVMEGLMLHKKGKILMSEHSYEDAILALKMSEGAYTRCGLDTETLMEYFSLCYIQIDIAWCHFMLGHDLSEAGTRARLSKAREVPHASFSLYTLRLTLLEGMVAFQDGQTDKCRALIRSAIEEIKKLRRYHMSLPSLLQAGFEEEDIIRALKMSDGQLAAASNLLEEEKRKKAQKREEQEAKEKEANIEFSNKMLESFNYNAALTHFWFLENNAKAEAEREDIARKMRSIGPDLKQQKLLSDIREESAMPIFPPPYFKEEDVVEEYRYKLSVLKK